MGECYENVFERIKEMKKLKWLTPIILAGGLQAQTAKMFIAPSEGFESYLSAALIKKHTPVQVTSLEGEATYRLSFVVDRREESTGAKVARCLFAYCAGIAGTQSVSVQVFKGSDLVWAYNVIKPSAVNSQSTAEAVAKHFKNFLEGK